MSTSYTSNLKLGMPAVADRGWGPVVNANVAALDALNAIGDMAVTPTEIPSASLGIAVAAGVYQALDGTVRTFAGATATCTANATNYVYLDATYTLQVVTTGWPATPHIRLAVALADAATITAIADWRVAMSVSGAPCLLLSGGAMADGATIAAGTTTGLKVGGSATQKLGFFGVTPVVQPTGGAATAGSSYTATEQAMLQNAYNALRALGLLS